MIFSFLRGVGLTHGAMLLTMESAPLLEDDEDVSLPSVATVFIKTFHFTKFILHCSEVPYCGSYA